MPKPMPPIVTNVSKYGYPHGTKIEYTYFDGDGEHVKLLDPAEAVSMERASAARLGMRYSNDEDALHDFITVHWCKVILPAVPVASV